MLIRNTSPLTVTYLVNIVCDCGPIIDCRIMHIRVIMPRLLIAILRAAIPRKIPATR